MNYRAIFSWEIGDPGRQLHNIYGPLVSYQIGDTLWKMGTCPGFSISRGHTHIQKFRTIIIYKGNLELSFWGFEDLVGEDKSHSHKDPVFHGVYSSIVVRPNTYTK